MSTSADLVQIAIVEEDVYGVTPTTPAFLVVRTTGEGIAFAPTTTKSNEMNPARQVTDSILTGGSVTGDLNFEMAHELWFDSLLAGAFCEDWNANQLRIGTSLRSFTLEKKIPVPDGPTQYHRYAGCTINGFSFDVKPNQAITGSFTVLGKGVTVSESPLSGATYMNPHLTPVMTAPRVVGIEIGGVSAVSQCFNNLQIEMNNNNRAIECIGTLGAKELALGRCEITATFGVLFSDSTLLQTLIDQIETSLAFETDDTLTVGSPAEHNSYAWFLPRVKFTANPVVAGGTAQDVVNAVTSEGLLDPTTGTALQVTRSDLVYIVPPVPTITSANTASATHSVPFSFSITASESPTSYAATGLPSGLSVNTVTGLISGTPVAAGTSVVSVSATNAGGTGTQSLTITVG